MYQHRKWNPTRAPIHAEAIITISILIKTAEDREMFERTQDNLAFGF